MSHHVVSEVYKRQVGKMPRVPVLALMADKASDDGRGIWASKQTLADELGCSKQTIISAVDALIEDGLLIVEGEQPCANGHTILYRIDVDALEALPLVGCHARKESKKSTGQKSGPVKNVDPTGQKSGPHRSKILTQTILEPSLNLTPLPPDDGGKRDAVPIPDDWVCPEVDALPAKIGSLARQWPDGAYQSEGEAFRQYWRGRGQRRRDWAAIWAARVQARHEAVMRADKAGVRYCGSSSSPAVSADRPQVRAKRREDERSAELHDTLRERLGAGIWEPWFQPAALVFEDCGLIVVAPSAFHSSQIENHHGSDIEAALSAIGIGVDWVRFTAEAPKKAKSGDARRG